MDNKYFIQTIGKGKGTVVKLQKDYGSQVNVVVIEYENGKFYYVFPYLVSKSNFNNYYKSFNIKNLKNKKRKKKILYKI